MEMAKRVMQMASAIFRFGVATSRCRRDPTADLKGALKPAKAFIQGIQSVCQNVFDKLKNTLRAGWVQ
jgi:hypothetical protein